MALGHCSMPSGIRYSARLIEVEIMLSLAIRASGRTASKHRLKKSNLIRHSCMRRRWLALQHGRLSLFESTSNQNCSFLLVEPGQSTLHCALLDLASSKALELDDVNARQTAKRPRTWCSRYRARHRYTHCDRAKRLGQPVVNWNGGHCRTRLFTRAKRYLKNCQGGDMSWL